MGKGILFLVLSTSFVLTQMKSGEIETEIATEQVRTEYEENSFNIDVFCGDFGKANCEYEVYRCESSGTPV